MEHKVNQDGNGNIIVINSEGVAITMIPPPASPLPPELNNIPYIVEEEFIGRNGELKQLKDFLNENGKVVVVNGIGGIGKSALAKAFTARHKKDYKHIIWVDVLANFEGDRRDSPDDARKKITDAFVNDFILFLIYSFVSRKNCPRN